MKSGKRVGIAAIVVASGAVMLRGELETWVQHVPSGPAIAALFRVDDPAGKLLQPRLGAQVAQPIEIKHPQFGHGASPAGSEKLIAVSAPHSGQWLGIPSGVREETVIDFWAFGKCPGTAMSTGQAERNSVPCRTDFPSPLC